MELTLSQVSIRLTFVVILIVLTIVFLRRWFALQKPSSQEGTVRILPVNRKNPSLDVFAYSQTFLLLGLAISLCCIHTTMSLTTYEPSHHDLSYLTIDEDVIVEEAPRTDMLPPPPPPPPPPTIEEIPNEEVLEEDQPEFEDQSINENTVVREAPPVVIKEKKSVAPPPPPPPPPPTTEVEEIFKLVEQMPLFGDCLDRECSDQELLKYLYTNLKYPPIARENGVEGKVYVQFVVEKNGTVTDIKIVRDVGAGCGLAAKKVVEDMNNLSKGWTPGRQRNIPVRVLYTLPVTFKLLN